MDNHDVLVVIDRKVEEYLRALRELEAARKALTGEVEIVPQDVIEKRRREAEKKARQRAKKKAALEQTASSRASPDGLAGQSP